MKKLLLITVLFMLVAGLLIGGCGQAQAPIPTQPAQTTAARPTQPAATTAPAATARPTTPATMAPTTVAPRPDMIPLTTYPPPPIVMPRPTTPGAPATTTAGSGTIGLATGGAKDVANFRENIRNNYLPIPTDISYEGLFYDYFFDTGSREACRQLYCPSYSFAVTRDPFSGKTDYYLSVGLNSGMKESDFERKKLNLVIVLDVSGSMAENYQSYYYDRYGRGVDVSGDREITSLRKMESAKQSVLAILDQLDGEDRFAIVLFQSNATLAKPMSLVRRTDMNAVRSQVMNINAGGNTNMSAGMQMATGLFRDVDVNQYEYENRIIFLTDAMPNTGDFSEQGLLGMAKKNASNRIYSTFIGIGLDFNTELVDFITKIKGANYYSVHSPSDFRQRIAEEFDFMVTPLVFDLRLKLESAGWQIEKVFGSPEADAATGEMMRINTLFPSPKVAGQTKGGIVLLKLKKTSVIAGNSIRLRVTYEDRNGRTDGSESVIYLDRQSPEFFDNSGIRKAVLLTRYAALIKDWIIDERQYAHYSRPWNATVDEVVGICLPPESGLGQWERTSLPLTVSAPYKRWLSNFRAYMEKEMYAVNDDTITQELNILDYLTKYRY